MRDISSQYFEYVNWNDGMIRHGMLAFD